MSRVLIGSTRSVTPLAAQASAARRRFATKAARLAARSASAGGKSCHAVEAGAAERFGVGQRLLDAGGHIRLAAGQGRHAALAPVPVAGRHVEQDHLQFVLVELLLDLRGGKFVRKQELDPRNPTFAAAPKRSRNDTSLNIIERLALNCGMGPPGSFLGIGCREPQL